MQKATLLLLEDDPSLHEIIDEYLTDQRYKVIGAFNAQEAQDLLYEHPCDLLLLDVKLPGQNGFDFLYEVRKNGNETPAIFITSLHTIDDLSKGFDSGCDDYLRKPFELKELMIRIEALLKRRFFHRAQEGVELGDGVIFYVEANRLVTPKGEYKLPPKEFELLKLLSENRSRVVSRENVFDRLWLIGEEPSEMSLRTHLKNLRKIIGHERIETMRGIGYRLL
ncbi:MAG: response regulator transcription factor [Helicobacteraceae bacterium]|jgi:DNA-binding response OmpR family regulator|nr:response regulator transcription factor [Helicobacteraceae bacterium]